MTYQEACETGLIQLVVDDHHGIYCPKVFCESFYKYIREYAKNLSNKEGADFLDSVIICSLGPDQEYYWESWEQILNELVITDDKGIKHTVMQDSDVFLVQKDAEIDWDTA